MIKIPDIKSEVKELTGLPKDTDEKIIKRARKRIEFLNTILLYLQSKPTEEFVAAEIKRLENRINLIMAEFVEPTNANKATASKMRLSHEKENGVGHLRTQLRALRFIAK